MEGGKRTLLLRAQALLERALLLLPQNTDPKLSESVLRGELAETYLSLGDAEQAVALLRRHNAGGHYDDQIGLILAADCNRPTEAMPFLSRALLQSVVTLTRVGMGYVNVYFKLERYAQAEALLRWTIGTLSGLKDGNAPCFLDKIVAMFLVCLAHAQSAQGEAAAAKEALRRAQALAEAFDRSPDYRPDALRFIALSDCLGGFAVVKTFQAGNEIFRLFADNNRALEGEKFSRRQIKAMVGMIGSVAGVVAQLGVFLAGAFLAQTQRGLTAGAVILFVNLMNFIIEPIAGLPALLAGRRAALGLVEKLAEMLEAQPETAQGDAALPALTRGIRLEHVSFSYDGKQDALQDISTSLEAGRAYAVVGASGSGKSTLLNLLMTPGGTYRGRIFLDDAELRDISSDALYSLLSVIQQNVFVFNASIADNITLFRSFPPAAEKTAARCPAVRSSASLLRAVC